MNYPDSTKRKAVEIVTKERVRLGNKISWDDIRDKINNATGDCPSRKQIAEWERLPEFSDIISGIMAEEDKHLQAEILSLRAQNKDLVDELAQHRKGTVMADKIIAVIQENIIPYREVSKAIKFDKATGDIHVIWFISDIHYNERVHPKLFMSAPDSEFPGLEDTHNEYDLDIAEARIRWAINTALHQTLTAEDPARLSSVKIVLGGDNNNGDIHNANVTNCIGSGSAFIRLADILSDCVEMIARELPHVAIDVINKVGNHGRLLQSQQVRGNNPKTLTENYDYFTGAFIKSRCELLKNVRVENEPTPVSLRSICGHTHAFTHGDDIRGGGGLSKVPMFGIAQKTYERTIQLLGRNVPLHDIHWGHWHRYFVTEYGLGYVFISPSVIGQTERGEFYGYSPRRGIRICWCTENHPIGANYVIDIPKKPTII